MTILKNCDFNLDNYLLIKYKPITSVDIKRSISMYKNILSPNHQRFSEDSLSKYIVIHFFSNTNLLNQKKSFFQINVFFYIN